MNSKSRHDSKLDLDVAQLTTAKMNIHGLESSIPLGFCQWQHHLQCSHTDIFSCVPNLPLIAHSLNQPACERQISDHGILYQGCVLVCLLSCRWHTGVCHWI